MPIFFALNMSKKKTKVYYKMNFIILYKIVWQVFNANKQAILRILYEKVNVTQFFLFYNNINFYKKVQDQKVYNKNYQVVYITRYIYFMKHKNFFFCHFVNYKTVNKLTLLDFLFALLKFQYQTEVIYYILSQVLSQYFSKKLYKNHIIINNISLPKYKK